MESTIERMDVTDRESGAVVGFHEIGTITMNGRSFSSGGAHVDPLHAIAYPEFERGADGRMNEWRCARGILKSWEGKRIGTCRITAAWSIRSYMGSTMYQIEGTIDGVTYTGRGFGSGMIWKGKRKSR